jgi:dipeptidase D
MPISSERVFSIFRQLNNIPRPSHHEERIADFLCQFAEKIGLDYCRDSQNCVVIRKSATPGHEQAEPVVLLNHMDMVCVGMTDPLNDPVEAYTEDGWMKARGTSLGADNGIGLSMALAVLESDTVVHGPLEVITTTNEEDGMSGAANLAPDFLRGRKVINLDSEDYDTITTGAAGACLQFHQIPVVWEAADLSEGRWFRISFFGGLGGHSGVDINKGRASATDSVCRLLTKVLEAYDVDIASIQAGEANASIPSTSSVIIRVHTMAAVSFLEKEVENMNHWLKSHYAHTDSGMRCTMETCDPQNSVADKAAVKALLYCLGHIPQGVVRMSHVMENTVETSNNIGRVSTEKDHFFVSTHTRSFIDEDMTQLSHEIAKTFQDFGASSQIIMSAPAWQENQQSDFLRLTSDTFADVLGWRPRMVAMHFVLEAGFFVQKFPGIEISSIGPRILEPHSASERVELSTVDDIWQVLIELLKRMA